MKLTDFIVDKLSEYGVDVVFGYTGGSIADLIDSVCEDSRMRFVQTYNEQGAAFAANAYAVKHGSLGACVASSGPGAINLINGIANAYFDSIPCVFITGNVHSLGRKENENIRQNAFQETDIVSMVKGITKYCVYIDDESKVVYELEKAIHLANDGRKGPVLIDIPYDIQRKDIIPDQLLRYVKSEDDPIFDICDIEAVNETVTNCKRPLLLLGGGCSEYGDKICTLIDRIPIPVVVSMRGLDVISHSNSLYLGFIGTYGNRIANLAVENCDCLIVLGSRLDERQMGYIKEQFAPDAKIIRVDIDRYELCRKVDSFLSINADVGKFIDCWMENTAIIENHEWYNFLIDKKKEYDIEESKYLPNRIVRKFSSVFSCDAVFTADVGQNQILCAQSLDLRENRFLCSAGLGCMGYSIPAAIGSYYANKEAEIVAFCGDGGFMMNMQELQTIKRDNLPIKIIVLNNSCLGLIRSLQNKLFDKRYHASVEGYESPDFEAIAGAWEMKYLCVKDVHDINENLEEITNRQPMIIEVALPEEINI